MVKFIRSAFADEYSDNLVKQCEILNELGVGYAELRGVDGKNASALSETEVLRAKKVLSDYGIKVSSIGSPLGKVDINGDLKEHFRTAERVFETASELGAKNVRIFSFYSKNEPFESCKGKVYDGLEKLVRLSEPYGLTLCHENEALIYGESPEKCNEIAEFFGGKIKCVFDMGNFVLDGYEPFKAYKLLFKHIEYFHVKDALFAGAIVPAGKGEAEIEKILADYKKNGKKDAFLTLEPHLQTFGGLNALVGKSFDNPYKYDSREEAFIDANEKLSEILNRI